MDGRLVRGSYRLCARAARRAASSFYWSFWLLPRQKRLAMCALYAFSRRTDDLADSDLPAELRRAALEDWRGALRGALRGEFRDPLLPALADAVLRFNIPADCLFDVIDGVEMDLSPRRYETFADLREYCLKVASAVGIACLHVWGFEGEGALPPAIECGIAFQLTNILRDLKEDASQGRVYLPCEDLARFGYVEAELLEGVSDDRFRGLMQFQIERAESHYGAMRPLYAHLSRDGRRSLGLMTAGYRRLLDEIKRRPDAVLRGRIRVSLPRKILLAAKQLARGSE